MSPAVPARARSGPLVLAILDGFGTRAEERGNAIAAAPMPRYRALLARAPHSLLQASGEAVGLPNGVMGNSEVGHINLGSGRLVPQGLVVINDALSGGTFARTPALETTIAHVAATRGTLHLLGLVSEGNVHSSLPHLLALVDAAAPRVPLAVHIIGDGRDVAPRSLGPDLARLEAHLTRAGRAGAIATLAGRFYAMDRDARWERVRPAYDAIARGEAAHRAPTAAAALAAAYAREESDEFVVPTVVGDPRPVDDGDGVVFFNFRPDRARELTAAFVDPAFDAFPVRRYGDLTFATMTAYDEGATNLVLFGPRPQAMTFGEIVANAGLSQLRLAETEKYAHITYFFNGGRETTFAREDRTLVPSDRSVATYDLAPAMRATEIADAAVAAIEARAHDVIVLNFANADMVGHTGDFAATVASLGVLDGALGRVADAVLAADGILAITADHGNAEDKVAADGSPLTAHTTHLVPFVLVADGDALGTLSDGALGDVAPTLLPLLGLATPPEMTGRDLLDRTPA